MNAMRMYHLHRPDSNLSCLKKIRFHVYVLIVLYLYVTCGELEWLTLTTVERHIIETHFKITYSSSNIF